MTRTLQMLFVLPLLLCLGNPAWARKPVGGAAGGTVTINKVMPRLGLIRMTSDETSMGFTLTEKGQTLTMKVNQSKKKSEKLLALKGSIATKLEVTFQKVAKVEVMNSKTLKPPSPLEGKTYVVEVRSGQLLVTKADGKPVTAEEQELVASEYKTLGKPNFMLDGLPVGPVRIGARIPSMEEALKKSFTLSMGGKPGEKWQIDNASVTLSGKGRVDGAAVALMDFGMAMTVTQQTGFTMTMHMKGTVTVRLADGWPIRLSMKGPLDIMGQKNAGIMTMNQKTQYK